MFSLTRIYAVHTLLFAQRGTGKSDQLISAAFSSDGTYVFGGHTYGDWNATNSGVWDWAVFKVDQQGEILWFWQVNAAPSSYGVQRLLSTGYVPLEQVVA